MQRLICRGCAHGRTTARRRQITPQVMAPTQRRAVAAAFAANALISVDLLPWRGYGLRTHLSSMPGVPDTPTAFDKLIADFDAEDRRKPAPEAACVPQATKPG